MATVTIKNIRGESVGNMELDDAIFGVEINQHAVHMAVIQYLANKRQGNKSVKTRSEVRGGGRKPWRQKGTGRARQGSTRSPQWTGGGVVFAPKPRDFSFKLNKKLKRLALKSVLTDKVKNEKLIVLDSLELSEIKTKVMAGVCTSLSLDTALIVTDGVNANVVASARNIPSIKTAGINTINVYDILHYDSLVITKDAIEKMTEVYA
ncbi:MAG: 50S ribosomal protein L4 [Defluviitaleaceae bacterium]|nr:50S ribosomal protein L4 [Defluviitaleaceae bacterium]